jgi:hypothetical protein
MASKQNEEEVPGGAAVVPLIPESACINPLFLAVFHALVFLDGSSEEILDSAAGDEAAQYLATYLQRMSGADLQRMKADLQQLSDYARRQRWTADQQKLIQDFLQHYGIKDR